MEVTESTSPADWRTSASLNISAAEIWTVRFCPCGTVKAAAGWPAASVAGAVIANKAAVPNMRMCLRTGSGSGRFLCDPGAGRRTRCAVDRGEEGEGPLADQLLGVRSRQHSGEGIRSTEVGCEASRIGLASDPENGVGEGERAEIIAFVGLQKRMQFTRHRP